jgi:uroporphyrinogen decarboxylase
MVTPRENILSTYRRQGCHWPVASVNLCTSLKKHFQGLAGEGVSLGAYYACDACFPFDGLPAGELRCTIPDEAAFRALYSYELKPGTTFNDWGVAHEPGSEFAHHMTRMRHPLEKISSVEQLEAHPWPVFSEAQLPEWQRQVAASHAAGRAVLASRECTIWETAWYIRGMPELMADMLDEDDCATALLDRITDYSCKRAAMIAAAGTDVLALGDDIGMQHQIMMSVEMWETWLKPRLAKVIAAAKGINPEILIQYHSCGYVEPFIPGLIEAGVDILNPVQPECMDFARLQAEYGDRLSFNGTIGTQTTMPFGSPEDVRDLTRRNLAIAGAQGGLVACPTHLLEPEVPWANIEAYIETIKDLATAGA